MNHVPHLYFLSSRLATKATTAGEATAFDSSRSALKARLPLSLVLCVCLLAAGCGGDQWQSETFPASGQTTINGEPAAGAVVELQAIDGQPDVRNSRPWGIVGSDGTYTLTTYEKGDGAPIGRYAVTLRWPPDVTQPTFADRLGGAYSSPQQSQWEMTINEGEDFLPPIVITDAKLDVVDKKQSRGATPPAMPSASTP